MEKKKFDGKILYRVTETDDTETEIVYQVKK